MAHYEGVKQTALAPADIEPAAIRSALEDILASTHFCTSKQCQEMLRYVVERTLKHEREALRERVIGVEVFGKRCDYDTSGDPVVRIRAADIRKRLAQYYQNSANANAGIRIDIPSGSYVAAFELLPQEHGAPAATMAVTEPPQPMPSVGPAVDPERIAALPHRSHRAVWIVLALVVVAFSGIAIVLLFHRPTSALEQFWSPVLGKSKPILIYGGANAVYRLSDSYLHRYQKEHHLDNQGPEFFVNFSANEKIDPHDLVPVTNTSGDPEAGAYVAAFLTRYRCPFQVRYGSDISAGDLLNTPAVFIGAFNNPWTMDITRPLRFVFKEGDHIEDTWGKTKGWRITLLQNGEVQDDYAVITRLLDPNTGKMFISVAGIGKVGTDAAAEFITSPQEVEKLRHIAPSGWQKMNMQVVLHVRVLNHALDTEDIVATQYW